MRKNCETCKHDSLETPICDECYNTSDAPTKWEPAAHYKPDTNADRIRAMSDEELAELLANETYRLAAPVFQLTGVGVTKEFIYTLRLKWLKQPAEE